MSARIVVVMMVIVTVRLPAVVIMVTMFVVMIVQIVFPVRPVFLIVLCRDVFHHFHDRRNFVEFQTGIRGDLFRRGFASEFYLEFHIAAGNFVQQLGDMVGNLPGLFCFPDRCFESVEDAESRIGTEISLLHRIRFRRIHKTEGTFLQEIEELHAASVIHFGCGNDETHGSFDEVRLCKRVVLH